MLDLPGKLSNCIFLNTRLPCKNALIACRGRENASFGLLYGHEAIIIPFSFLRTSFLFSFGLVQTPDIHVVYSEVPLAPVSCCSFVVTTYQLCPCLTLEIFTCFPVSYLKEMYARSTFYLPYAFATFHQPVSFICGCRRLSAFFPLLSYHQSSPPLSSLTTYIFSIS